MSFVWDNMELKGNNKLVMLCLADFANDEGYCYPSIETIARKSGIAESTTKGVIKRLVEGGFLQKKQRSKLGDSGRRVATSNAYYLNIGKVISGAFESLDSVCSKLRPSTNPLKDNEGTNFERPDYERSKQPVLRSQITDFEQPESGYDPSVIDPLVKDPLRDLVPSNDDLLETDKPKPEFELPTNRIGEVYAVYTNDIFDFRALYQAVDVMQEFRNMLGWLRANPSRRKTKSGMARFINSWLSKEQDRGRSDASSVPAVSKASDVDMINNNIHLAESKISGLKSDIQKRADYQNSFAASAIQSFKDEISGLQSFIKEQLALRQALVGY
ncbi:helix-turn-helix domain-containing protein [Vibrio sp. Y2-5]|uniref:helix-turn-helix domain-containing protein n=1 Tax=Vibrio sp. Y2-5 TaxID=2743977 RepID=UPI00166173BD|nr:helix-turn-helix domain-containing protein [Vibrio sp. Y2-5]